MPKLLGVGGRSREAVMKYGLFEDERETSVALSQDSLTIHPLGDGSVHIIDVDSLP